MQSRAWLALTAAGALTLSACAATAPSARAPQQVAQVAPAEVKPLAVSEADFAQSLQLVLADGSRSPQRLSVLAGVVRRQFDRAAQRFELGEKDRGVAAVIGALYLVRVGELVPVMLEGSADKALAEALEVLAPQGREGPAMALLELRSAALPKQSPEQARIQQHLKALRAWINDTRQRTEVENTAQDAILYSERLMLQPTPEALNDARQMTERWIAESLDFNANFGPQMPRPERDTMLAAYRGVRTGALVLAGLHLRQGDAADAVSALESSEARRITPPELFERLETAAATRRPVAWRQLAGVYANGTGEQVAEEMALPAQLAQGATWGAALEAYRRAPAEVETAVPIAALLAQLGMAEASPIVLADAVRESGDAQVVSGALRMIAGIIVSEEEAGDHASATRVFHNSRPILTYAQSLRQPLDPSPWRVQMLMAEMHVRAADLQAARPLFEQALAREPLIEGYNALASVLAQAGQTQGALEAIDAALKAPDAAKEPLARAEAHLTAFQIERERQRMEAAREHLGEALQIALQARGKNNPALERSGAERLLARIAYYYGDTQAWQRAVRRLFELAGDDRRSLTMAVVESSSGALLAKDVAVAREAVELATEANLQPEDIVYPALWLQLAARAAGQDAPVATEALASVPRDSSWTAALAAWGQGTIDDKQLRARAHTTVQRAEADFYCAMRERLKGSQAAQAKLEQLADGPAIGLVETYLARELTQPVAGSPFGAPPTALP